jgi:hypothetical protein
MPITKSEMRLSRIRRPALLAAVAVVLVSALAAGTVAAFKSQADDPGNSVSSAPDYRAPTVSAQSITKSAGGIGNYLAQGQQFYVYANVTDTGNPASGIAPPVNVIANLPGYGVQTLPLTAGSYSVVGVSYNYRSGIQTMPPMAEQSIPFTIDSSDNAGNSGSTGDSVVIDNTGGTATTVQTANGGTAGRPDNGDTITYTFSEPPEPMTILPAWSDPSSSQTVTVNVNQAAGSDTVTVTGANLGTITLGRTDYVTTTRSFPNSTMTRSGNDIQIVLGGGAAGTTAAGNGTMSWASSNQVDDRAGNAFSGNTATESGTADKDF